MSHFSSLHLKLCRYNSYIKMTLHLLINLLVYICVINCVTCLEVYAFEGKAVSLNIVLCVYNIGFLFDPDITDNMVILICLIKVHTCCYCFVERDVPRDVDFPCQSMLVTMTVLSMVRCSSWSGVVITNTIHTYLAPWFTPYMYIWMLWGSSKCVPSIIGTGYCRKAG